MTKTVTPSHLRQDIYRLIDQVIATGEELHITRKGNRVKLAAVADEQPDRLARIVPISNLIVGDPEDLVHLDWSTDWDAVRALSP